MATHNKSSQTDPSSFRLLLLRAFHATYHIFPSRYLVFNTRFLSQTKMNFYFEAAKALDRLDAKQGSVKGIISTLPEKDRKRTAALIIETLKCKVFTYFSCTCQKTLIVKAVLGEVIENAKLMKERKLTSVNLVLVLIHDLLLARGIQAGDGPIKQAILRNKTRLNAELQKIKIKRGVISNDQLARNEDEQAGFPSHS